MALIGTFQFTYSVLTFISFWSVSQMMKQEVGMYIVCTWPSEPRGLCMGGGAILTDKFTLFQSGAGQITPISRTSYVPEF